jgi:hypothetical protein
MPSADRAQTCNQKFHIKPQSLIQPAIDPVDNTLQHIADRF